MEKDAAWRSCTVEYSVATPHLVEKLGVQGKAGGLARSFLQSPWPDVSPIKRHVRTANALVLLSTVLQICRGVRPMYRTALALAAVGLIAFSSGCTMCCSPYDYCGPTFTGGPGESCCPSARAGSVLSGGIVEPTLEAEIPPDQIISVTDEKVDQAQQAGPATADAGPISSGQWTALAPAQASPQ